MIKKNDFIEIEFTGKIKDTDEVFDTNIKVQYKKYQAVRSFSWTQNATSRF
jgi:FKBP-type peptidyl-prolyl cis-trans isomerase 2